MAKHPEVDPRMWNVEANDVKHGRGERQLDGSVRYLRRDLESATALGRIGRRITRRITRRMRRRYIPAA